MLGLKVGPGSAGDTPCVSNRTERMSEWLTFNAKGEPAPDGSSNASIAGFICADGTGEDYPDFSQGCGPTLGSWQVGAA